MIEPHRLAALLLATVPMAWPALAAAQTSPRSASGAYDAKDWKTCARLYSEQAERTPPVRGAAYDAACCLALAGDVEGAFARLQRTPSEQLPEALADDLDLAALHGDPRWQALLVRYRADNEASATNLDTALLEELTRRVDRDQEVRNRSFQGPQGELAIQEAMAVDRDNTAWLKRYLDEHGWPPHAKVGRKGSQGFWLLAQHADADPRFQEQVLEMLGDAVARGEASGVHLAYLSDRVRLAQGRPQRYGTQFERVDGTLRPRPIEDADTVDARRAALGMETLDEYAARMEDAYAADSQD